MAILTWASVAVIGATSLSGECTDDNYAADWWVFLIVIDVRF